MRKLPPLKGASAPLPGQMDLFGEVIDAPQSSVVQPAAPEPPLSDMVKLRRSRGSSLKSPQPVSGQNECAQAPKPTNSINGHTSTAEASVIRLDQLPAYAPHELELVDSSFAALPAGKAWFTYQDIQESFGISRATVARKVKAGLVPGIRFAGGRVVEEGPVRRFSRSQVRFVLLAVRRRTR